MIKAASLNVLAAMDEAEDLRILRPGDGASTSDSSPSASPSGTVVSKFRRGLALVSRSTRTCSPTASSKSEHDDARSRLAARDPHAVRRRSVRSGQLRPLARPHAARPRRLHAPRQHRRGAVSLDPGADGDRRGCPRDDPADKTVVVGISHTSADESIALARDARDHGAAAVLCSAPYYFDNCAAGLLSYFRALAAKLELPLVLYDNPAATKTVLPAQLVLELAAELEQVQTIKLTDHNLAKVAVWQEGGLSVLAGDDTIVFRSLAAGVDGAMVIAPAVFPSAFRAVWDAVRAGDTTPGSPSSRARSFRSYMCSESATRSRQRRR